MDVNGTDLEIKEKDIKTLHDVDHTADDGPKEGELLNVSGHIQEISRTFGFWSICSLGVLGDNAWGAGGGSLVISLYNGGGPGVMYGLLAAIFFYTCIGLSLAELASALPSSANVYHWASVTAGPRYGRVCSWYSGYFNWLAWVFGAASASLFAAESVIAMYSLYHPDYVLQRWHVFIVFVVVTWMDLSLVLFGQRILAKATTVMGAMLLVIFLVVTLTCAIMPSQTGYGYASNAFVWGEWQNLTGWDSDGLVFLMGILNGAYAIGTPDAVAHMSEECPQPRKNIPYGILAQMVIGSITTFAFYTAVLYCVTDLEAVFNTTITALPLAAMFQQGMRSNGGTLGLLILFFIDNILNIPGGYITAGRQLWVISRDDATPFSGWLRHISARHRNPFNAQLVCGICVTCLGAVYVGNATAFTAIIGTFTIFTTWSYLAAILPHLLSGRRNLTPGPFFMPAWVAYPVSGIACAYIIVFSVIYMFPYTQPTTVSGMNYACVMTGGSTLLLTLWYLWKRNHGYEGPKVVLTAHDDIAEGVVGLSETEEKVMRMAALRAIVQS